MGLLNRTLVALGVRSGETSGGSYPLPVSGGWLSAEAGANMNWWQMGYDPESAANSAMVEACIGAYSQAIAQCPGNHWRWTKDGGRERVTNSALVRILKRPNDYQTISDFLLNAVRQLYLDGNAYALVIRNDRFEPYQLHLMNARNCAARVSVDGEVFYHLGGNAIIEQRLGGNIVAPARDVLHLRLQTPRHPLIGESPVAAAALDLTAANAALNQQVRFFLNQARPSFILTTDQVLTKEQVEFLRESWNQQAAGMNRGGTPILTAGLKAQAIGSNNKDTELASILKMSDASIAMAFRVPMAVIGQEGGTPYASTEALMQSWKAQGLGFALNHIEEAIGNLFKLAGQPDEYLEFDTSALLRSNFKERVEAWAIAVRGGIAPRNAALADFEMAPVEYGDEVWVQQQDLPLSVAGKIAGQAGEQAANPPAAMPAPEPDAEQERAAAALFEKELREALRA